MKLFLFHPTILRTAQLLWAWLWGRYHVPQNVFLVLYALYVLLLEICMHDFMSKI